MSFYSATRTIYLPKTRKTGILSRVLKGFALYRQRQVLAKLDATALRDIGLSEADVQRESQRPIWDAPAHYYR